jgi:hypothetical protein
MPGIGAGAVRSFSGDYLLAFMTSGLACLLASLLVLRIESGSLLRGVTCEPELSQDRSSRHDLERPLVIAEAASIKAAPPFSSCRRHDRRSVPHRLEVVRQAAPCHGQASRSRLKTAPEDEREPEAAEKQFRPPRAVRPPRFLSRQGDAPQGG